MKVSTVRRARSVRRITPGDIVDFFNSRQSTSKPKLDSKFDPRLVTLTNTPTGLGDSVMMTDIEMASNCVATSWLSGTHFRELQNHNPYHRMVQHPVMVSLSQAQAKWDLGPGHNFQRARRMFGLPVDPTPKGHISIPGSTKQKKVTVHLEAGPHSEFQRRYHPTPRVVYPGNISVLRKFIERHDDIEFVEIGSSILGGSVREFKGSVSDMIREMSSAMCHIGIISGPYHVAAAIGIRTICIINFPSPWELMLPVVKNVDVVEAEWLYPQTHVLHQDHDSAHWPLFDERSLEAAWNRDTFPYEDPINYLSLVSK